MYILCNTHTYTSIHIYTRAAHMLRPPTGGIRSTGNSDMRLKLAQARGYRGSIFMAPRNPLTFFLPVHQECGCGWRRRAAPQKKKLQEIGDARRDALWLDRAIRIRIRLCKLRGHVKLRPMAGDPAASNSHNPVSTGSLFPWLVAYVSSREPRHLRAYTYRPHRQHPPNGITRGITPNHWSVCRSSTSEQAKIATTARPRTRRPWTKILWLKILKTPQNPHY